MVKKRIIEYLDSKNMSPTNLEKTLGWGKGAFLKAKSISADRAGEFLLHFKDLSADWLITGKGDMLKDSPATTEISLDNNSKEGIPLIPISAMAGAFGGQMQVLEAECDRYVVPSFKGADFLIPVKGNSMSPTYDSGDIVACKKLILTDLFFQWNKVYVIDTDQGVLLKRIRPGEDKSHILIVSDNPDYAPFQLPISKIYHVALVIGVIRLE